MVCCPFNKLFKLFVSLSVLILQVSPTPNFHYHQVFKWDSVLFMVVTSSCSILNFETSSSVIQQTKTEPCWLTVYETKCFLLALTIYWEPINAL